MGFPPEAENAGWASLSASRKAAPNDFSPTEREREQERERERKLGNVSHI